VYPVNIGSFVSIENKNKLKNKSLMLSLLRYFHMKGKKHLSGSEF
jgi:hypothetical protein